MTTALWSTGSIALTFWVLTWFAYSWARGQGDNFGAVFLVLLCAGLALWASIAWLVLMVLR